MAISSERGKLIFRKTERELLKLAAGYEPEVVHGFRTTTLRLQVLLEQLIPTRDRNAKKLLKLLNRIRKRAGRLRDLDVQLTALRSLKVPLEPRRKTQLTQQLIELRAKHENRLGKLLKKREIRELQKRLRRASREVRYENSRDPLADAGKMLESVARPAGQIDEEVLHRYRIVVKRARYTAKFAPKSVEAAQFLSQLKRLQDALGNWHDWLLLTHTAEQRLGEINRSPLVAALYNVTRGKFRHAVAELAGNPNVALAKPVETPPRKLRPALVGQSETAA
jgi:CHAD domain-containing protein